MILHEATYTTKHKQASHDCIEAGSADLGSGKPLPTSPEDTLISAFCADEYGLAACCVSLSELMLSASCTALLVIFSAQLDCLHSCKCCATVEHADPERAHCRTMCPCVHIYQVCVQNLRNKLQQTEAGKAMQQDGQWTRE